MKLLIKNKAKLLTKLKRKNKLQKHKNSFYKNKNKTKTKKNTKKHILQVKHKNENNKNNNNDKYEINTVLDTKELKDTKETKKEDIKQIKQQGGFFSKIKEQFEVKKLTDIDYASFKLADYVNMNVDWGNSPGSPPTDCVIC